MMEARYFLETARRLCVGNECKVDKCPFAYIRDEKIACMLASREPCYFDVDRILEVVEAEEKKRLRALAIEALEKLGVVGLAKHVAYLEGLAAEDGVTCGNCGAKTMFAIAK